MDNKPLLWIVALVVALFVGWQLASAQGDKEKSAQTWEYKSIYGSENLSPDTKEVTRLGKEGWELIAVEPALPYVQHGGTVRRTERIFYFKRPL